MNKNKVAAAAKVNASADLKQNLRALQEHQELKDLDL